MEQVCAHQRMVMIAAIILAILVLVFWRSIALVRPPEDLAKSKISRSGRRPSPYSAATPRQGAGVGLGGLGADRRKLKRIVAFVVAGSELTCVPATT
jgi:hypothetical protein